jgi:hypothetical protein
MEKSMRQSRIGGPFSFSRRTAIAAAAAAAFAPVKVDGAAGSTAALCTAIIALDDEVAYLHCHYGDLESRLATNANWFRLNEEARRALPEAAEFNAVSDRLPEAIMERDNLMNQAASYRAHNIADVIGKITVAARCASIADEDETTPAILNAVVQEIQRLSCPTCGATLTSHSTP